MNKWRTGTARLWNTDSRYRLTFSRCRVGHLSVCSFSSFCGAQGMGGHFPPVVNFEVNSRTYRLRTWLGAVSGSITTAWRPRWVVECFVLWSGLWQPI